MTRIILSTMFLALIALTVTVSSSTAWATSEKKGFMGFFNRSSNDGSDQGGPIHMQPNIGGSSNGEVSKPMNLGKKEKLARYEDSPIHAERKRAAQAMDNWNKNELAKANASTVALNARMAEERAYNKQVSAQQQAQAMAAQAARRQSAGTAPGKPDATALQAMRAAAAQQAASARQAAGGAATLPPPSSTTSSAPAPEPADTGAEQPKRERKARSFFNRIEE